MLPFFLLFTSYPSPHFPFPTFPGGFRDTSKNSWLTGSQGVEGEREGTEGKGGEMTQTFYVHMNKKNSWLTLPLVYYFFSC
jgi:hypothetical protein